MFDTYSMVLSDQDFDEFKVRLESLTNSQSIERREDIFTTRKIEEMCVVSYKMEDGTVICMYKEPGENNRPVIDVYGTNAGKYANQILDNTDSKEVPKSRPEFMLDRFESGAFHHKINSGKKQTVRLPSEYQTPKLLEPTTQTHIQHFAGPETIEPDIDITKIRKRKQVINDPDGTIELAITNTITESLVTGKQYKSKEISSKIGTDTLVTSLVLRRIEKKGIIETTKSGKITYWSIR